MRPLLILAPALALAACNAADKAADATANATETAGNAAVAVGGSIANAVAEGAADLKKEVSGKPVAHDDWVGRWKGVEGTYLVVAKGKDAGTYKLEMQYTLDDKGSFEGTGTRGGIAFERPDGKQVLRASDGDATGLKYLAGKKDCLSVKSGEGYCRD
ncbi:hypothetical protein JMG10_29195 [Nostoc ellipsosporum NOK]|uniref:hypothetical protein n=1 Tax=Sphingomonas sp. IBVSS2 TaxID=1985172 RepID=UPI000A2E6BAA|nr:hypothetical protein [Sphingomonas sp. IBVSS2]MDF2385577.1 hypothetical protein [Nostoc ellipsosporum NOK]OSZ70235.1 hypothetical protein CAP40_05300 [Sphingomonas sp. IBVSS2]